MSKMILCVKFKALPGKRNEVKNVWERLVKPHAETSQSLDFCCYSFVNEDEDSIILFEILAEGVEFDLSSQEDWFKKYLEEMGPLLAGPPELLTGKPIWIKGS